MPDHSRMDAILAAGLRGVHTGLENATRHAEEVVRAFSPESSGDPVTPLVHLQLDKHQVAASAKVIKVGNELIGSILDIVG